MHSLFQGAQSLGMTYWLKGELEGRSKWQTQPFDILRYSLSHFPFYGTDFGGFESDFATDCMILGSYFTFSIFSYCTHKKGMMVIPTPYDVLKIEKEIVLGMKEALNCWLLLLLLLLLVLLNLLG